jgi:hypothetical protein
MIDPISRGQLPRLITLNRELLLAPSERFFVVCVVDVTPLLVPWLWFLVITLL